MKRLVKIAGFFLIALGVWVPISRLLTGCLVIEKPLAGADAIYVLSGSEAYLARTEAAAELYKAKTVAKIFLTNDGLKGGWNQKEQRNPYFAERARWNLIDHGVPEEAIEILPTIVEGTMDEADLLIKLSAERNIKSLLLVTSAYHSRRALWTFERAARRSNLQLEIGMMSPVQEVENSSLSGWELSINGWRKVGGEYIKIVYYWLVY